MNVGRTLSAVILAASAVSPGHAAAVGADTTDRLLAGDLIRVDVGKRTLVLRPSSGPAREADVTVDAATVITASGRVLGLEELKTGERIAVSCAGAAGGPCRARRVRAGPARHAAPPAATR